MHVWPGKDCSLDQHVVSTCRRSSCMWGRPAARSQRHGACTRAASTPGEFFAARGQNCPRAVLVDAEPKVVERLLDGGDGYAFDQTCAVTAQSGRGGNFALGYSAEGLAAGMEPLWARALQCTRRQVEGCYGSHLGTMMTYSLGGGTGSGLGSRLAEEVHDLYPKAPLLVTPVLPISSGENPMQCYNVMLALLWLQESADGIILYENDSLMAMAEAEATAQQSSGSQALQGTSLACMNSIIARDLTPHLCPAQSADAGDLLTVISPLASHKFAQAYSGAVRSSHEVEITTKSVVEALRRMPRVARNSRNILAARAVVRGVPSLEIKAELLERLGGAVSWQPFPVEVQLSQQPLKSAPASRTSLLVNWKRVTKVLRAVHQQACQKYSSRMFLHWYENYGFGQDIFAEAFEVVERIISNYESS
ncbi:unnamed protein product [Effrenium voratum]|nr:unnamed protein product [Effrenium voratum]